MEITFTEQEMIDCFAAGCSFARDMDVNFSNSEYINLIKNKKLKEMGISKEALEWWNSKTNDQKIYIMMDYGFSSYSPDRTSLCEIEQMYLLKQRNNGN